MKILVIGANGMIGSTILRSLENYSHFKTIGTVRNKEALRQLSLISTSKIIENVHAEQQASLAHVVKEIQPNIIINCAGLTKHKPRADDPIAVVPINTVMPHRLAELAMQIGARVIHVSTDCVFSGSKGFYSETDFPDAKDYYGQSKSMGELHYKHTITLRTSTIGHEIQTKHGLLEWFLMQKNTCSGFKRAIFSGLPTIEFAKIIAEVVIPNRDLSGLYHVAATPITKFDLLTLIAKTYRKSIDIMPDENFIIDRSLDASRFKKDTGYTAPSWAELIRDMHDQQ